MAKGAPDGILLVQVAVTVETAPVPVVASDNFPKATYADLSTSSATYEIVKEIEVTTDRVGILRDVEMSCSNYAVTQWKLVVAGVTVFEDELFPESFSKGFPDLEMSAGQKATLSAKSDGSTAILAYCDFNYKEVG